MKFISEIIINKPIGITVGLFDNPQNLMKWMKGLQKLELMEGQLGQPNSKARLVFLSGGRKLELIQTVIEKNLPDALTLTYESKGVYNIIKNRFEKISEGKTKYIAEQEFRFTGFMKILGILFPGMFKKQALEFLQGFKDYAESQ